MRAGRGGRLRLLELIIDLCVFALCAVVCVLLLVRAQRVSVDSRRLTQAVYLAQSAAERWKATGAVPAGGETLEDENYLVDITPEGDTARVTVTWRGETVYVLEEVGRNG